MIKLITESQAIVSGVNILMSLYFAETSELMIDIVLNIKLY